LYRNVDILTSNSPPCPSVIIWRLYCFAERDAIFHQHTRDCLKL